MEIQNQMPKHKQSINGLVQERRNSSVLALELCLSCINSSDLCIHGGKYGISCTKEQVVVPNVVTTYLLHIRSTVPYLDLWAEYG